MKLKIYTIRSDSYNPYHNQAIEEYLLNTIDKNRLILYLWQNDKTVFIGKNQSAYDECHLEQLERDGAFLARRISGGGAVYHDLGNINFTFVCTKDNYDLEKHNDVIIRAMNSLGIDAYRNGRNDLLVAERKFSGHAYYQGKEKCFHHGTIMLEVNSEMLQKYLNVSLLKLNSKNVSSVRSRVINLKEINPDIDIEMIVKALTDAFVKVYDSEDKQLKLEDLDSKELERLEKRFKDHDWTYGKNKAYPYEKQSRFDWGTVKIQYEIEDDCIKDLDIYTDALNTESIEKIPQLLIGKKISDIETDKNNVELNDIIGLLKEKEDEI